MSRGDIVILDVKLKVECARDVCKESFSSVTASLSSSKCSPIFVMNQNVSFFG